MLLCLVVGVGWLLCHTVSCHTMSGDAREQRARMDVDEPTAKAVGGEILPMIFVVSKAIEYIKNQILDRVVSHVASRHTHTCTIYLVAYVSCDVFKFYNSCCSLPVGSCPTKGERICIYVSR